MITTLTKKQQSSIKVYLNKWLKIGLRTKTVDKKKGKKAINFLYEKILKIEKPKYVIFLDSPMACQLAANLIKNTKLDSSQLDSQLDSQLRSQKLEYFSWNTNLWWWPGWTGFYDYLLNELFKDKKSEFKLFSELTSHWSEVHYYLLFPEIAFVSDFPKAIRRNARHELHSTEKAALEYHDTWGVYRSNNVTMPKHFIETPADQITKEMFLKETNADVRREVSRKLGINKTVEMLGAEVVDTYKSKVGGKYELLMIDFNNNGTKRPYLKMQNPSLEDVYHIEGIKPGIKTVKDAIMYRNQLTKFIEPKVLS